MSNIKHALRPVSHSGGVKSISDDDICSDCSHCDYRPGNMSSCALSWPGLEDRDGYVRQCQNWSPVSSRSPARIDRQPL